MLSKKLLRPLKTKYSIHQAVDS